MRVCVCVCVCVYYQVWKGKMIRLLKIFKLFKIFPKKIILFKNFGGAKCLIGRQVAPPLYTIHKRNTVSINKPKKKP